MWREIAGIWRRMWKGVEANVETTLFAVNSSWLRSRIYLNIHLLFGQTQALPQGLRSKLLHLPYSPMYYRWLRMGPIWLLKVIQRSLIKSKDTHWSHSGSTKNMFTRDFTFFGGGTWKEKKKKKTLFILLNEFDQNVNRCWLNMGLD